MNSTNTENTAVKTQVFPLTTEPVIVEKTAAKVEKKPERTSQKGTWGKVGAPPKTIKHPRGAFTINQLKELNKGQICELTLRNTVTNGVRGYKLVNGKKVSVPVTYVRLPKNFEKDTVGRPNFRFMTKAAFEAAQNKKATKSAPKTESVTLPVAVTEMTSVNTVAA